MLKLTSTQRQFLDSLGSNWNRYFKFKPHIVITSREKPSKRKNSYAEDDVVKKLIELGVL